MAHLVGCPPEADCVPQREDPAWEAAPSCHQNNCITPGLRIISNTISHSFFPICPRGRAVTPRGFSMHVGGLTFEAATKSGLPGKRAWSSCHRFPGSV